MDIELKLHYFQKELIKRMTLNKPLRFNELIIDGLESEHMNYHLKKLLDLKLVTKEESFYSLSDKGKDYSNLMEDDMVTVEKQPKTSIIIRGIRKNSQNELEHLLCKRLRHPYFGKVGRLTGKVRFGETLREATERELYEETGLRAKTIILENIYRKIRYREDGQYVQDVIFYTYFVTDFEGSLIEKTPFQKNFWIISSKLLTDHGFDVYDDFEVLDNDQPREFSIKEHSCLAEGF